MKNNLFSSKAASFFGIILSVFFVVTLVQASTTISTNIVTEGTLTAATSTFGTLTVTATTTLNTLRVTSTSTLGAAGIGTLSPSAPLDIGGFMTAPPSSLGTMLPVAYITANTNNITGIIGANTSTGGLGDFRFAITDRSGAYITMSVPDENFTFTSVLGQVKNSAVFLFTNSLGTARNLAIGTVTASHVIFATTNIERMRITSGGNAGIGTSTPTTQLQVTASATNATSTVTVGKVGQNKGSCLELFDSAGTAVYAYVPAGGTALTLSATSCK